MYEIAFRRSSSLSRGFERGSACEDRRLLGAVLLQRAGHVHRAAVSLVAAPARGRLHLHFDTKILRSSETNEEDLTYNIYIYIFIYISHHISMIFTLLMTSITLLISI